MPERVLKTGQINPEVLDRVKAELAKPKPQLDQFGEEEINCLRDLVNEKVGAQLPITPESPKAKLSPEKQTLITLKATFDETAPKLRHGLSWETVQASLEADQEAVQILGDLIARGGKPTVTEDENGQIMWDESVADVPLDDFKGIPMNSLAYDETAEKKVPKGWNCRGNAVAVAARIHSRVQLTSKARAEKLVAAGLVKDNQSFPWLHTPEAERGNMNDQYAGRAWYGYPGYVRQHCAYYCNQGYGARFSLGVKKIDL